MADRYVRSGGGNWNAAGTWESTPGGAEVVLVPTAADDVYLVAGSGQLTINATAACRSFDCTGYTGILTHSNSIVLTVGTSSANGTLALKFVSGMTYTLGGSGSTITFNSSAGADLTVDFAEKTVNTINFSGGNHQIQSNYTQTYALTHTAATLDINGKTITFPTTGSLNSTGTTARTLTFGAANFNFTSSTGITVWTCSGSNLTITANTATAQFTQTGTVTTTFAGGGLNYNGLTMKFIEGGGTGGVWTITGANTFKNLSAYVTSVNKYIYFPQSVTTTITDDLYLYGTNGYILYVYSGSSGTAATISKSSGTVNFYQCIIRDIAATGGATFTANANCTNTSNNSGITFSGGIFYVDYVLGSDSVSATPYGWWSVSYTSSTGTIPALDEVVTGATSGNTAKVNFINTHEWSILTAGTMYFYGKSGAFQAETVNCAGGGSFSIAGDFTYCPWLSVKSGATAARISPADIIRITKSSDPTNTGQDAIWNKLETSRSGLLTDVKSIGSSTNATPIVVTINGHGYSNGDIIRIYGHLINTSANGIWKIQNVATNTFELAGSVGNGIGVATGTAFKQTHKAVILTTNVTKAIDNCEGDWTVGTNVTSAAAYTTAFKQGGCSLRIVTNASHAVAGIIAKKSLPAELNLSGYQQISFWYYASSILTTGLIQVKLYSDVACTLEVESFNVPVNNPINYFIPCTVNKGSAMSSTVNGISIYATAAFASKTFVIDNIIACKATSENDSITLQSLISKNSSAQGGDEPWLAIQSISGDGDVADKIILLDQYPQSYPDSANYNNNRGYSGAAETVPLYKRETIKTDMAAAASTSILVANESGTSGKYIEYQGGYNSSDNAQDGETFFDGSNGLGYGLYFDTKQYIRVNRLNFSKYSYGIVTSASNYNIFTNITNCCNNLTGMSFAGNYNSFGTIGSIDNSRYHGIIVNGDNNEFTLIKNICSNYYTTGQYGLTLYTGSENNTFTEIRNLNNNWERSIFLTESNRNIFTLISNINESGCGVYLNLSNNNYFGEITNLDNIYYYNYFNYSNNNIFNEIGSIDSCGYTGSTYYPIQFVNSNDNIFRLISSISNCLCTSAIYFDISNRNKFDEITTCSTNGNYAFYFGNNSSDNYINKINSSGHTTSFAYNYYSAVNYFNHAVIDETEIAGPAYHYADCKTFFQNLDNTTDNHWIFSDYGTISSNDTDRHTASGICWKLSPTNVLRDVYYPLTLKIAKVACNSGSLVTIKAWMKRSSITDIQGTFMVRAGQLNGVSQTYADGSTGSAILVGLPFGGTDDTNYHEGTITFTPTETGVIEVECWAWWLAGTADESVYIDDMTITQA